MPIRIRKDKGSSNQQRRISRSNSSSGRSGSRAGSGLLGMLLPIIINLFKKKPKLTIALAVIGVALYFFMGSGSNSSGPASSNIVQSLLSTGLNMDQKVYDKAEVFEPLADNIKNPLPERVTLEKNCPKRRNQGAQGSCVGWSSGYAARTILMSKATGQNPNDVTFSPSFVYNQIALEGCQGTYLHKAMELMKNKGALPFSEFAYNENSCNKQPSSYELQDAASYRTKGFNRLSKGGDNYATDLLAIKQNLAQGAPVVIGMMVGGTFMSNMTGKNIWIPKESDYKQSNFGGHAMCVIGYDDYLEGGAFQIMNSWGEEWGNKGMFWIRYNDFEYFNREAYGLYPMGDSEKFNTTKLAAKIGLVQKDNGKYFPIEYQEGIRYKTTTPIKIDTDFKIEITNSVECYTYIFGQETDKSSYVLFPYTPKHSPYCGITGTRVFPKDYSLYADNLGTTDYMMVLVSKQKLDFNKLNDAINNANANTYEAKVENALENELARNVKFGGDNGLATFNCDTENKSMVAMILEIEK